MALYVKRVQTVLSEEQYATLSAVATKQGKPLSTVIRDAIKKTYFEEALREQRYTALATLLSLESPVADWEQMEDEIVHGALG